MGTESVFSPGIPVTTATVHFSAFPFLEGALGASEKRYAGRAAAKLTDLAGKLVGDRRDTAFGEWSIADADLAFALHRLIANYHDIPANLRAYAETQWARPSVRAYLDHPREPFVPYNRT